MKKITTLFSLALLFSFFYYNVALAQDSKAGVAIGAEAPGFDLMNIDGENIALGDFNESKGVILIFTCNHCPFSKLYEERIVALDKKYKEMGYPVVAINPNDADQYPSDSYENMKLRAKEKGFTFPYLYDDTQAIATAYGATRTPHAFLLKNTEGNFKVEYIGAIDDSPRAADKVEELYIEKAIKSLEAGEKIEPASTKAIGCSIKWKKA